MTQGQDREWNADRQPVERDALGLVLERGSDREMMADMKNIFTYHSPKGTQARRYEILRDEAGKLAQLVILNCPHSRERSLAITHLQQAVMFANAAIAIRE